MTPGPEGAGRRGSPRVAPPSAIRPVGRAAILAEYPDTATVLEAAAAMRALDPVHLVELVPAERTLLLVGSTAQDAAELHHLLGLLPAAPPPQAASREQTIAVVYDGEDLEQVAALLDMSTQALVTAHTDTAWVSAFGGFAPGFSYLLPERAGGGSDGSRAGDPGQAAGSAGGGSEAPGPKDGAPTDGEAAQPGEAGWQVPRREEPRHAVPVGAVALASHYSAIYPRSSPGGWQLIGRTEAVLFDPDRTPPTLLPPGTRVRFEAQRATARVGGATATLARAGRQVSSVSATLTRLRGAAAPAEPVTPALEVLTVGPLALVEDTGRPGRADIGVPTSGVFDRGALVRSNLAVGNPGATAGLEVLIGPLQLRALSSTVIAVDGGRAPLSVHRRDQDSAGVDLAAEDSAGRPIALDPGDLLELGPVTAGLRMVLAVRGGIRQARPAEESGTGRAELGSLSRDTLSGLGPAPLSPGDVLGVGPEHGLDAVPEAGEPDSRDPAPQDTGEQAAELEVELRLGPRDDLLGQAAVSALLATRWTVREDSDRVGVRLEGEPLPVPRGAGTLPSEAMVPGAIQVPPSGLPVVFGPDHPTTGGYPVIGVVTAAGLDLLAQAGPGRAVRLVRGR